MSLTASFRRKRALLFGLAIGVARCGGGEVVTPEAAEGGAATGKQTATTDEVCEIVAGLFGVDRSQVRPATSLSELNADELDFVELVMELEERYQISIPDATAEGLLGTENWQEGMKNVTMAKLAAMVDERRE